MNQFFGEGNLGLDPNLKSVRRDGEENDVVNLRIYFDRPVKDGEGNFEDKKGFWLNVEVWGGRATHVARLCAKGSRVAVIGSLMDDSYEKDGETITGVSVRARQVYLVPTAKLERVHYRSDAAA